MEINKSSIGQTNCDLPTKNNPIINSLSLQRVFRSDTRYYLVQFTNFSRQRMLLTFDAMTGRMKGCGERGADTDCEHPSGHGGAHDLLPVPCRLQQQRVCSRGRKQKSWRTKIVADNIVICNLSIKFCVSLCWCCYCCWRGCQLQFQDWTLIFSRRRDAPEPGLNPASAVALYTTYCMRCLWITLSIDG